MAKTIVGLFDNLADAQQAVVDLVKANFKREDISLIANDTSNEYSKYLDNANVKTTKTEDAVKAGQGAGFGAVVGGLTGVLVGLGALAIPGIGPVLAAGPLISALGGGAIGAVTGAATGGIVAALVKTGVPQDEAPYYAEGIRRGGTMVTVRAQNDTMAEEASDILNQHHAVDIKNRAAQWQQSGWTGFDPNAQPYQQETRTTQTSQQPQQGKMVLPVEEEELKVGKREVERGGVHVEKRVTEQPVEQQVNLHEEHVNVERRPVDRPVSEADRNAFQETSFDMKERAEEPVVEKQAHVVEEVVIDKNATDRAQTVRDTVRRSDVDVQKTGGQMQSTSGTTFESYDFRNDYNTNYAKSGYTYDQYMPAYRYGYNLAQDPRYQDWNTFESDARQQWEARNPNTWDRFKAAVRYAWEQARGTATAGR